MRNTNLRNRKGELVVPSHGGEFPKDPESRLEALLAGLNLEPKQVLVLTCLDDKEWQTAHELWYKWKELETEWSPTTANVAVYCKHSLIPNGLVRTHSILYQNTVRPVRRYKLSEEGAHYGRRSATLMLKYAVDKQTSMQYLLGKIPSPGKSIGPINRVNLLKLMDSGITSPKELVKRLKLDKSSLTQHRLALKSSGLIEYQAQIGGGKPEVTITNTGKDFLENLIKPINSLCKDNLHELVGSTYFLFENPKILKDYATEGIKQYRD